MDKYVMVDEINVVMKKVMEGNDVFGYIEDLIVFFDIIGFIYGFVFDLF